MSAMRAEADFDENAPCDACGRFGSHGFDGARLCPDCYEKRGSCCPEFGADDLWPADDARGNPAGSGPERPT
jgi:hypothetical protein